MKADQKQPVVVVKEMGLTHKEFFSKLPRLLKDVPYQQDQNNLWFEIKGKKIEIILSEESVRILSRSASLPVTLVTLRFFESSKDEVNAFIERFNLRFLKGGG